MLVTLGLLILFSSGINFTNAQDNTAKFSTDSQAIPTYTVLNKINLVTADYVAVNPAGTHLAVASRIGIHTFALPSFEKLELFIETPNVGNLAWSPDGTALAFIQDGKIKVWDLMNARLIQELSPPDTRALRSASVEWSPDGKHLFSAGYVWQLEQGALVENFTAQQLSVFAWSPDAQQLALGHENKLIIWDLEKGIAVQELSFSGDIWDVDWSQHGLALVTETRRYPTQALVNDILVATWAGIGH